jgi:hypothetical protein
MKHARLITRSRDLRHAPERAQTGATTTTTPLTSLDAKVKFMVDLTDRIVSWVLQKGSSF